MQQLHHDVLLGERYRLVGMIGSGGMGTVWEAQDQILGRPVAVKVLSAAAPLGGSAGRRFEREARAAARLSGARIASVYDFGRSDGRPYIVMELIRGETLAERLAREGSLPSEEAARIATQVAQALDEAHATGVVHRDVKPGNVMVTPTGEVKVMDFGIAAASWADRPTTSDLALGTPSYLPPEQARGERPTPASDVYALGAVLYEMLTGRPPFVGDSPVAVALAHVRDDPEPVEHVAPDVPPNVAAATMAALAKDPADRPASAAAFASLLGDPTVPPPSSDRATQTRRIPRISSDEKTTPLPPVTGGPQTTPLSTVAHGNRDRRWLVPVVLVLGAVLLGAVLLGPAVGSQSPKDRSGLRVGVPDLGGMTVSDARRALTRVGLMGGDVRLEPGERGVVISSDPPAGARVTRGSSITLFVGAGSRPSSGHQDHGNHFGRGGGNGHGRSGD
jgi:serine/threonine protein kinase